MLVRFPIPPNCFVAHDINITMVEHDLFALADGSRLLKPHIAEWNARAKSEADSHAPLLVAVPTDATVGNIVVVVCFTLEFFGFLTKKMRQRVSNFQEVRNVSVGDDCAIAFVKDGFLFRLTKAKVPPGVLI